MGVVTLGRESSLGGKEVSFGKKKQLLKKEMVWQGTGRAFLKN